MNTSRNIEGWVLAGALASLAGLAGAQPLASLGGAALAALVLLRPPRFSLAGRPRSGQSARRGPSAMAHVFHAFSGGEWLSSPSSSDTEDGDDSADAERGSRAYEEFAAGLEEESSEEISFLPPYASGSGGGDRASESEGGEPGGGESLIAGDLGASDGPNGRMPVPRRFALGTVAIIRRLLEPSDVERILLEQRRYPRLRFGDVAVQLGLLTADEVQELLVAQEEGIFSEQEIADARRRLADYHQRG